MSFRELISLSAIGMCIAFSALAQDARKTSQPEDVGFSTDRLERLSDEMQVDVDKGTIPGAVIMVSRKGKIAYLEAFGFQDREKQIPMKTDAIFRIASMSKPFTSVAIMMLVEQGRIKLSDPVSTYLPELKNLQVGVEKVDAAGKPELDLEPARAEATILDMLRHTSGFTYGFFGKPTLVKQAYLSANLLDPRQTLAEIRDQAVQVAARLSARNDMGLWRIRRCFGARCRSYFRIKSRPVCRGSHCQTAWAVGYGFLCDQGECCAHRRTPD